MNPLIRKLTPLATQRSLAAALTVASLALPGAAAGATDTVTRVNPPEHRGSPTDHRGEYLATFPTPPATAEDRFDWGDAAVGAGAAIGVVVLGGVGLGLRRRVRAPNRSELAPAPTQ